MRAAPRDSVDVMNTAKLSDLKPRPDLVVTFQDQGSIGPVAALIVHLYTGRMLTEHLRYVLNEAGNGRALVELVGTISDGLLLIYGSGTSAEIVAVIDNAIERMTPPGSWTLATYSARAQDYVKAGGLDHWEPLSEALSCDRLSRLLRESRGPAEAITTLFRSLHPAA